MKVPVTSPQNHHHHHHSQTPNPKPVSCNNTNNNSQNIGFIPINPNLCYEPTSVLDLCRSPSPARAGKPASTMDPIEWDDHVLQTLDWDSIMRELDFHDDSVPALIKNFPQFGHFSESQIQNHNLPEFIAPLQIDASQFVHSDFNDMYINSIPTHSLTSLDLSHSFHNNTGNWNVGFDFIQELIKAADCIDSNELQLGQVILERLHHRLPSPIGKPLQRAAFYFKEALQFLLTTGSTRSQTNPSVLPSWSSIVQTIKAYEAFFSISPIPMFIDFTTDQAILDSLSGNSVFLHVIDFDIGFGCHYASLMRELVDKADSCNKLTSPLLRITAVVTEDTVIETKLIKERLAQFAQELKIRFHIDFVLFRTFEMLSFKAVKFVDGEQTAVLLSPIIFRRVGSTNNVTMFVNDLHRVSPSVVIFVDSEGWAESGAGSSFRRNFVNSLEFYSMMFESLDAAAVTGGDWARKIEMFVLKPRILKAVEGCGRRVAPPWREVFVGAGMRPVQFSQLADFQAESLLGKVQVRGFYVAKRQAELVLCWHDRPLIATSTWKC